MNKAISEKDLLDALMNDNEQSSEESQKPETDKEKDEAEARVKSRIVEPFDIFGDHSLTGKQEAQPDMFPSVIWNYAEDAAKRPGLNPGPIAAGCLVTAAAAIREGWKIQPKLKDPDWVEPPILWLGITGSSGAKKTHVLNSSKMPLELLEKKALLAAEEQWKNHRREKAQHNELMKAWRKECQALLKEDKNAEIPEMPEAPETPNPERYVVKDTTTEALMKVCASNPSGVLQVRDELTEWISGFDMYAGGNGGRDRAKYLTAWNGGTETKDRAGDENGPMVVKNFGVSIFGGIQDDIIKRDFSATKHDGFLARFLFVKADILKGQDIDPNVEVAKKYADLIVGLTNLEVNYEHAKPGLVQMSEKAAAIREDVEAIALALNDHPTIRKGLSDHINKWPAIFSRLCLVFHMLKCVDREKRPENILVSEDTARRAYDLLTKYFLPEAARIYNDVMQGGDEQEQHARWIAGHILAQGLDKISVFEIRRAFSSIANDDWALKKATASLELMAWIRPDVKKNGTEYSRADFSKMKFRVNPRVHELFAEQAKAEEARRRAAVEKIQAGAEAMRRLRSS
ncbi:DUF3987 domain-containing protein [Roseinatronobacter sp.]|uniref:DUF3987 domain-containing protein n=1 Tax=Roseinatronobacter sp. TaxID=1945755 RepID=UPI0025ECA2F7|nr:DUF3987 domain-containing protein [Roseibaca sp.]